MEKKKLREDTRIDENELNVKFKIDKICIAQSSDLNLRKTVLHQSHFTDSNSATYSRPVSGCKTNIISNDVIEEDSVKSSEAGNKDTNFEYEDEWNIGGIPELLNELDADIEKSLKVDLRIHSTSTDCDKHLIIPREDRIKSTCNKSTEVSKNFRVLGYKTNLHSSEKPIVHSSTFAGFSKGGYLISATSPPTNSKLTSTNSGVTFNFDPGMSSQAGNNSSTVSVSCGNLSNISGNQSGSSAGNSTKSNSKMSIDHQATLDKGLKMKIKRTKPGTKSSEAKHEIVKATEQLQNGVAGNAVSGCTNNSDDNNSAISGPVSTSSTSQNNIGNSTVQNSTSSGGSKKNVGSNANHLNSNISSGNSGNTNSEIPTSSNSSQSATLATKRVSSGHRRDKIKDKTLHSNRTTTEKNASHNNDKDQQEKSICNCCVGDNSITSCSSNVCIRRNESTVAQCLQSSGLNNAAIPPGVFTPSTDTPSTVSSAGTLLSSSTTVSSPAITHSTTSSGSANAPGPPNRDASSGGNIKISSHIAAQLAAAAASNYANGSALTNTDLKLSSANVSNQIIKEMSPGVISATVHHSISIPVSNNKSNVLSTTNTANIPVGANSTQSSMTDESCKSPPTKRARHNECKIPEAKPNNKEMVDICIGTSVGTITEPDCLGPCEPGTSVTLEGIVWHETEGGVLVINVTWRGKTYVGTLLDCTRHDWAPPRFCDSPTDELDSRTPKGRGKRGRAVTTPDLSNFTETRSSIYFSHPHVHSKLRNGSTKGGRASSRTSNVAEKQNSASPVSSGNGASTPSTSPTAFLPPRAEKRKSKDEPSSPTNVDNDSSSIGMVNASGIPISSIGGGLVTQPQSLVNPVTGLNVQISAKKCKTSSPCAISPVLLECPEQDCSKKYKHANGLRYHQSHAHGSVPLLDDDAMMDVYEPNVAQLHSPVSLVPTTGVCEQLENSQPLTVPQSSALKLDGEPEVCSDTKITLPLVQSETTPEPDGESTMSTGLLHIMSAQSGCAKAYNGANMSSETSYQGLHSHPLASDGNKMNVNAASSIDQSNTQQSPTGKTGVLRFGQSDSSNDNMNLVGVQADVKPNQNASELTSNSSESPRSESVSSRSMLSQMGKDINTIQSASLDSFNVSSDGSAKKSHNPENNPASNKVLSSTSIYSKQKKNRKSPVPNEFDVDGFNTSNVTSREEVQSPAYSDISDDSTPISEQQPLEKINSSKNTDINKKSDVVLSTGSGCSTSVQTAMPSPLGGYGVYQFYQQQQFVVQPSIEQQQATKSAATTNITQSPTVSCAPQQSPNLTEFNRKEPALDLITKPSTLNTQNNSPTPEDTNKDLPQTPAGMSTTQGPSTLSINSGASNSSKSVSHFYAFNYMSPSYPFNVDQNYVSVPINAEEGKSSRHTGILSPSDQHQSSLLFKDDRGKDHNCQNETVKGLHQQQIAPNKVKSEPISKTEHVKADSANPISSQIPHLPVHAKDLQGMGVYTNMYQRHPMTLTSQQMTREEELRRYYIISDQQRRQGTAAPNINITNQQGQGCATQSSHQQCKDDSISAQANPQTQQQIKIKPTASLSTLGTGGKITTSTKESPKQKHEDELKVIKQEGQKPTMETQGPPPPPTSQYFLHPSYIAPTPFGFDPNHPMYRNVLMPPTSPYNSTPYHLPMPRYHAPEDLSRNTGTKALDVLHHAASQYYTTHKIHELSERALKSPNNSSNNGPNTIKVSVPSPTVGTTHHSNINANSAGHHLSATQPTSSTQLSHNVASQAIVPASNKPEIQGQKTHGSGSNIQGASHNETQKLQTSNNTTVVNSNVVNASAGGATDSRSPPPQRHVHTHHHTHVGLGYPMYPAPYGAAVLASQQAAAVAVINPFPPGPPK